MRLLIEGFRQGSDREGDTLKMKRYGPNLIWLSVLMMTIICPALVDAYYSYGARATGMGGAFTGMSGDASIFYWNPGGSSASSGVDHRGPIW